MHLVQQLGQGAVVGVGQVVGVAAVAARVAGGGHVQRVDVVQGRWGVVAGDHRRRVGVLDLAALEPLGDGPEVGGGELNTIRSTRRGVGGGG